MDRFIASKWFPIIATLISLVIMSALFIAGQLVFRGEIK